MWFPVGPGRRLTRRAREFPKKSNVASVLDLGLSPVTPEAAGSSLTGTMLYNTAMRDELFPRVPLTP